MIPIVSISRKNFRSEVEQFEQNNPEKSAFVDADLPSHAKCYVWLGGNAGFAIVDGDIRCLFNGSDESVGSELIEAAKAKGGETLDCFDGFLPNFYEKHGFVEKQRFSWDDELAPDDFPTEKFGKPDVVVMELDK